MGKIDPEITPNHDISVIHREPDPGVARLLEAYLNNQDIPCRIVERLQTRGGIVSINPYPLLLHEILVFKKDASSAEHLINQFFEDHKTEPG